MSNCQAAKGGVHNHLNIYRHVSDVSPRQLSRQRHEHASSIARVHQVITMLLYVLRYYPAIRVVLELRKGYDLGFTHIC